MSDEEITSLDDLSAGDHSVTEILEAFDRVTVSEVIAWGEQNPEKARLLIDYCYHRVYMTKRSVESLERLLTGEEDES